MTSTTAVRVRWLPLQVTPKTCWTFVEIEDREGRVRVGDETLAVRRAGRQRAAAAGIRDGAGAGPSGTRRAARRERRATPGRVSLSRRTIGTSANLLVPTEVQPDCPQPETAWRANPTAPRNCDGQPAHPNPALACPRLAHAREHGQGRPDDALGQPLRRREYGDELSLHVFEYTAHGCWSRSNVRHVDAETAENMHAAHSAWLRRLGGNPRERARAELRNRNLACWCPLPEGDEDDKCHAAILLRIANR